MINLNNTTSPSNANKSNVENNLREVAKLQGIASKYEPITRLEFLTIASKYLIIDAKEVKVSITYKDLTEEQNKIANYIFSQNNTWKDEF
ncbi:MAG: hypothetical protein LBC61_00285 [Candidatus Peribacteria bacterium]|nr:hypothetical protein [Candidatus Peribacteria bacterium]